MRESAKRELELDSWQAPERREEPGAGGQSAAQERELERAESQVLVPAELTGPGPLSVRELQGHFQPPPAERIEPCRLPVAPR